MKRFRPRPVLVCGLAALFLANQAGGLLLAGSLRAFPLACCGGAGCAPASESAGPGHQPERVDLPAPCACCGEGHRAEAGPPRASVSAVPDSPTHPTSCPCCQHGCVWCAQAKMPCCHPGAGPGVTGAADPGARFPEAALFVPAVPRPDLTRPPRA